jgi:hypothetical protein
VGRSDQDDPQLSIGYLFFPCVISDAGGSL